jgi:hypothetical protein
MIEFLVSREIFFQASEFIFRVVLSPQKIFDEII